MKCLKLFAGGNKLLFRVVLKCCKCNKETFPNDGDETFGTLFFDFTKKEINFYCPFCKNDNKLNLGDIESFLKQKTSLPIMRT